MAQDTEPRPARVAKILVYCPPGTNEPGFGTGYQISDRLVLTARHVVDKVPKGCDPEDAALFVELGEDGKERRVTCVWCSREGTDLALLRLDEPPRERVSPVRLGRVDVTRPTTVSALAIGYPKHAEVSIRATGEYWRGRTQVPGHIRTATTGRPGTLHFQFDDAPAAGPFRDSPWNGMSGSAVFTAGSHLLVGVVQEHNANSGVSQQTIGALDAATDQQWRDLLTEDDISPDPRPVFPDGWNQDCTDLLPHGDYLDNLADQEPFLGADRLPFVDPGDHPSAPRQVLAALTRTTESADPRLGVMLVGIPGIGKTRLCLETAALAERAGWLVVHLRRRDNHTSLEEAWQSLKKFSAPVLLVVEDLEWLAGTALQTVRSIRAPAQGGTRLAVLGPARTTTLHRADWRLPPKKTFDVVEVRADPSYQAGILRQAVRNVAKDAVHHVDEAHLLRICRGIPAIAVLLADYYNREAGRNDISAAVPLDDLGIAGWLRDMLNREELRARRPESASEPSPTPDGRLTAAVWIAAATPRAAGALTAALERRGEILSPLGNRWSPLALLESLCRAGILTRRGDTIHTVHDLYADRLLEEVLVERDSGTVWGERLGSTLDPGLDDQQVLRNVAVALQRLRDSLDDPTGRALDSAVARWCVDRGKELTALLDGDPEGQTLHTLLRLPTWRPGIRRLVEPIAELWLKRHYRDPKFRDGILAVASCLDPQVGYPYVMGWLSHNLANPRAAFAFHRLSPPEGVDAAYDEWTVERAFQWLTQNKPHPNASFVLQNLLDHGRKLGLPPGHPYAARVVAWALGWLVRNGPHRNASYVAPPLVQRPELTGAELETTAFFLLDKVAPREPYNASFALEAVLARHRTRRDLPDAVVKRAVKDSLDWLEDSRGYGLRPQAAYVLENLIPSDQCTGDALVRVVDIAMKWLARNKDVPETGRVIDPMLHLARRETYQWAKLRGDESARLAEHAVNWLSGPRTNRSTRISLLGSLLATQLIDDDADELRRCTEQALALYQETPFPTVARDLLPPLLRKTARLAKRQPDLANFRADLLDLTFDHVDRYPRDPHTSYPLTSLVSGSDLGAERYATALAATLNWLGAHPTDESGVKLLAAALRNPLASRADQGTLVDRAVGMLSPSLLGSARGRHLVKAVRAQRAETTPEWNRFVGRACAQVTDGAMPGRVDLVLQDLLHATDVLDEPVRHQLHATCVSWCAARPQSTRVFDLLPWVLRDRTLPPALRHSALAVACAGLTADAARVGTAGRLLAAVLQDGDLGDPAEADRVLAVALDWLENQVHDGTAVELLPQVAHRLRRDAGAGRATRDAVRRAVGCLDVWLLRHPAAPAEKRAGIEAHRDALALLDPG
ncbi:hypothetical protein GCM10022225_38450 [Plantactinospora mayteni]|uniref:Trypsin-like peptidase domain-containing protein n=1 Tax=Plantactinospora mayteni TaxID=566021 RepID=A0ABQ4EWY4_9ACTN|nr:serine protease [Plantactinospora mayteni]GIG99135.1 hypothetical protein Pma05_57080 [Plantactinospora mayteni]